MQFILTQHDRWHTRVGLDDPAAQPQPHSHALLTLAQWHAARDTWPADVGAGVILPNTADVSVLASDLPRLKLVALEFPKWVDGRAYSQARVLRARHRFEGEIRATGEVLVDMVPLLARCGFDTATLRADQNVDSAQRTLRHFEGLGQFSGMAHYQGDVLQPKPHFARAPAQEAA